MPRHCSICVRSDDDAIAAALDQGRSLRSVALERGMSVDALERHARHHLGRVPTRPSWAAVLAALEPFPEALQAVVDALTVHPAPMEGEPDD